MSFANNLVLYENFLFDQRYDKQVHYTNKHKKAKGGTTSSRLKLIKEKK